MVKIDRQIVPSHIVSSRTNGAGNKMEYIAIHETANTNSKANAQAHSNLQLNGNRRKASWHYQVDDKEIIQSFEDNIRCWHVGNYNNRAIAIEICVNSDGNFNKAVENAVALTKHLMAKHNIPISKVKQHNFFTGKNCPTNLRNGSKGLNWNDFINKVKGSNSTPAKPSKPKVSAPAKSKSISQMADEVLASKVTGNAARAKFLGLTLSQYEPVRQEINRRYNSKSKSKTTPKPTPKPKAPVSSYTGSSLVDYLKSIKVNSSYSNRKKLAKKYGINNYSGTASQNTLLLNKMRVGSVPKKATPKGKSISQMASKIINDKNAPNGHEARRKWLGVDNATYQKVRAEVNRRL